MEAFGRGSQVLVPHKGRIVLGRIVRCDPGKAPDEEPYCYVDVGQVDPIRVVSRMIQQEMFIDIIKDTKISGTDIILEKGDKIRIIDVKENTYESFHKEDSKRIE